MKVYRRSKWSVLKLLLLAIFAAIAAYFVAGLMAFQYRALLQFTIPPIILLALGYVALFSERMRLELDDAGVLRYYRGGALAGEYKLPLCKVGRREKGKPGAFGSHGWSLYVLEPCSEELAPIDCSALQLQDFEELYRLAREMAGGEIMQEELPG